MSSLLIIEQSCLLSFFSKFCSELNKKKFKIFDDLKFFNRSIAEIIKRTFPEFFTRLTAVVR